MIQVKPLSMKDWSQFHQSLQLVKHEEFDYMSSERFEDLLFDERDYLASIWNEEGIMVGMLQYSESKNKGRERNTRVTSVDLILIHPSYRKKGYGKKAVEWLIGYSKTRYISCFPVSREGKYLFQSLGFQFNDEIWPSYEVRVLDKEFLSVPV